MPRVRKIHTDRFKLKLVNLAIADKGTPYQIGEQHEISAGLVQHWLDNYNATGYVSKSAAMKAGAEYAPPRKQSYPKAAANGAALTVDELPSTTNGTGVRRKSAKPLIPMSFACPHCGEAIAP